MKRLHKKIHDKLNRRSGMALVLVLSFLLLITTLVVFTSMTVRRDLEEATNFAAFQTAQQLADSAVDVVIGQIREATSGFEKNNAGAPILNRPLAWASQPGAVRTFRLNGDPHLIFKLYSTRRLVTDNPQELTTGGANSDIPTDWASRPALFTDLNAPVANRFNVLTYPIADPQLNQSNQFSPNTQGFSYTGAPTANTTNPLPMPAQWIYVLRDGTLTSPTVAASTGSIAGWTGTGRFVPSASNPIIGRIAFWTDDDTAKVNINTASDGTYWDTPRFNTIPERNFANFQPVRNEFQRFPGHPATTSLVPVFFFNGTTVPPLTLTEHNDLLDLIPRINGGGSNRGTTRTDQANPITPDNGRIYANIDELIYGMTPAGQRTTQPTGKGFNRDVLERSRFFLTAHSRAPETNLFNGPRVALWPIDTQAGNRTAIDNLIALCSTVGGFPFYFQRSDPRSQTADFNGIARNRQIFGYLRTLTDHTFPGFGRNYCLVPDQDGANINWKNNAPRYDSFRDKYGVNDRDAILTQIFDYIRTTNTDDTNHMPATSPRRYGNRNLMAHPLGMSHVTPIRIEPPDTNVVTKGHGRFPTITEVGFHFICTADEDEDVRQNYPPPNKSNIVPQNRTLCGIPLTPGQRRIEAMFYFEGFSPSHGYPNANPAYVVRVRGLNSFLINGISLQMPADGVTILNQPIGHIFHARSWLGTHSHRVHLREARLPTRGCMPQDGAHSPLTSYPFVSAPITINLPLPAETMSFSGGRVTLEIYARTSAASPWYTPADLVQTIEVDFPAATFPAPRLVTQGTPAQVNASTTQPRNWWSFSRDGAFLGTNGRIFFAGDNPGPDGGEIRGSMFRRQFDTTRSLVPAHADYRILSGLRNIPSSYFVPHPNYNNVNQRMAHNIAEGLGGGIITGFNVINNPLVNTPSGYAGYALPDVPIAHPNSALGDWDTGISYAPDGPYINKPDEGNLLRLNINDIPYFERNEQYTNENTFFSATRQVPSGFMLGSLSTGIFSNVPYRTLLFRPETRRDTTGNMHFGLRVPRDHLLADLFWMPVVEPYAISEPLATAGKINMNYRIAPFNYIRRATGLHAVLHSERVAVLPHGLSSTYKNIYTQASNTEFRMPINHTLTLDQFERIFDSGAIFRSATEIADLHIVPQGTTIAAVENSTGYWNNNRLTGDNLRERIYATLLPRLTTKSNTYTVHFRVQALQQRTNSTNFAQWDDTRDTVLAEFRGSATIERYLDPNQPNLPDFAQMNPGNMQPQFNIDRYYRFRVINIRRFAP